MNVNSTVIIEALSFLITYRLLDRILFRPLVHAMHEEDRGHQRLRHAIEYAHEALQGQKAEFKREQTEWRLRFALKRPSLAVSSTTVMIRPPTAEPLEQAVLDELVQETARHIIQKAKHDCIPVIK